MIPFKDAWKKGKSVTGYALFDGKNMESVLRDFLVTELRRDAQLPMVPLRDENADACIT